MPLLNKSMLIMVYLAVVSDNLHPTDHCADGEESEDFRAHDGDLGQLLAVDVADAAEDAFGCGAAGGRAGARQDGAGVAGGVDDGLQVRLKLRDGWRSHLLALENDFGELQSNTRVVDSWWY